MTARPLIANGIPKSGTHFIDAIVKTAGLWQQTGYRLSVQQAVLQDPAGVRTVFPGRTAQTILEMQPGQYANGHLAWTQEIEDAIIKANALHVMFYRDPRDCIVSMMRWQTYNPNFVRSDRERERQNELRIGFVDDSDRAKHFILLMRWNTIDKYAPWLHSPACHAVRFEDAYSEIALGTPPKVIPALLDYLGITHIGIDDLRQSALHSGITSSGEESKIGRWRELFKEEHFKLLDFPQFKANMRSLGYE